MIVHYLRLFIFKLFSTLDTPGNSAVTEEYVVKHSMSFFVVIAVSCCFMLEKLEASL